VSKTEGTLVAHTLCHTPAPGFEALTPYILGIVKLVEGPRVFARVAAQEIYMSDANVIHPIDAALFSYIKFRTPSND
jgi:uncharacterized OB-fold protein